MAALTAILTTEDRGRLKAELQSLRRKGALKASADFDSTGPDPERSCGRCRVELGRVINRGAYCRACRLKVCKGCREYSFRTTDWVCTVCHKHMEIQAASGEWMNEFVRRPSRRRDNRVYVPAADIIKRTIRRSWTISNPTPRWNAIRGSPEIRPYNSLPRGQDISNYPSLIAHQIDKDNKEEIPSPTAKISPISPRKHSPARRSHSEDVYCDIRAQDQSSIKTDQSSIKTDQSSIKTDQSSIKTDQSSIKTDQSSPKTDQSSAKTDQSSPKTDQSSVKTGQSHTPPLSSDSETKSAKDSPPVRVNPLIKFAAERRQSSLGSEVPKAKKKLQSTKAFSEPSGPAKFDRDVRSIEEIIQERKQQRSGTPEKRVSFDDERIGKDSDGEGKQGVVAKKPEDADGDGQVPLKEEGPAIELCDIEPLSGTVFRKVTVRRRRQDYRKISASENGWRTRTDGDLIDILLPEGDDYKLVFISSSDSSSKEEDIDDNDSSSASTSSSFPLDDCDWDYFEPGSTRSNSRMLNWNSPFGSPGVYRRSALESPIGSPLVYRRDRFSDEDNARIDSPASSDGFSYLNRNPNEEGAMEDVSLQCAHQNQPDELQQKPCQSCGAPTQYVPIPVPVPIPIPMLWTADSLVLYNNNTAESLEHNLKSRLRRSILPLLNQAAFIWPLINDTDTNNLFLAALQSEAASRLNGSAATTAELNVSKLPANSTAATLARDTQTDPAESNENVTSMNAEAKVDMTVKVEDCIPDDDYGYLLSEYKYVSSSTSSSESEDEAKPRVKRTYNVTGGDTSTSSDDALPSSEVSDDETRMRAGGGGDVDGDPDSDDSSQIEDSDSESADTDDTGTVADKKSAKKFSCVYVVNKRRSSGESRSDSDKSDDDGDDEESGIILTHIKHFSDSREFLNEKNSSDSSLKSDASLKSGASLKTKKDHHRRRNKRSKIDSSDDNSDNKTKRNSEDSDSDRSDREISNFKNKRNKSYKNVKITKFKEESLVKSDRGDGSDREIMQLLFEDEVKDKIEEITTEVIAKESPAITIDENYELNSNQKKDETKENSDKFTSGNSNDHNFINFIKLNDKDSDGSDNEAKEKFSIDNLEEISRNDAQSEEKCELNPEDGGSDRNIKPPIKEDETEINQNNDSDDKNDRSTEKNLDKLNDKNSDGSDNETKEVFSIDNLEELSRVDVSSDRITLIDENFELELDHRDSETNNRQIDLDELNDENNDNLKELPGNGDKITTTDENCESKPHIDIEIIDLDELIDKKISDNETIQLFPIDNLEEISRNSDKMTLIDENCESKSDHPVKTDGNNRKMSRENFTSSDSDDQNDRLFKTNHKRAAQIDLDKLNNLISDGSDNETKEIFSIANLEEISRFDVCDIVNSDAISLPDEVPILKIENDAEVGDRAEQGNDHRKQAKDSLKEYMSSPGLSDVSAESLSSSTTSSSCGSDTEQSCPLDVAGGDGQLTDSVECGEWAGGTSESDSAIGVCLQRNAARYTSLVMITQENNTVAYPQVSVVTSDTTMLVPDATGNIGDEIIVRHTNWQDEDGGNANKEDRYFTLATLESNNKEATATEKDLEATSDGVTVITGGDTLSAVVCLEEGLADDDSWVENLSHNEDDFVGSTDDTSSGEEVTLTCSDQEDELRGYHRAAIDFTLHTIVEESCEESEVEQFQKKPRPKSATDLEKYFFYGLGDGTIAVNREDAFSETSSICSESMDSIGGCDKTPPNEAADPAELASSRLENYFLTGFMGFTASRRDSDGSVGSDSEGKPSPEQRRKRLVRARGTGRSHSSSLDNLLANPDLSGAEQQSENQCSNEDSSSDSDTYDESNSFEKSDGQFDTVKRKKNKKKNIGTNSPDESKISEDDQIKIDKTEDTRDSNADSDSKKQQRDSGFIGSSDDLIKDQKDLTNSDNVQNKFERISKLEEKIITGPPMTNLTRKDSFNNWSSDEETNLMMCKMRQFFKTMVAANNNQSNPPSKPSTPIMGMNSPKIFASPKLKNKTKPPQLVYFENELTRLMKTVPGIRDDQVREIVEYLSSEDTWSDSYDSSDYTSSDLEGTSCTKTALQQQISDSCQQIINKFDKSVEDEEGDEGDGGIIDETSQGLNKETAFVYQKLVASFEKMATGDNPEKKIINPHNSPPLIAKVMHHIGKRLVALMHEVSSGESHCSSNSPKTKHYHRRFQQKLYSASSTTTEDDDSTSDSNLPDKLGNLDEVACYNLLPRSRSHDLLVSENRNLHQSSSGVSDIAEEREVSDCERFSWRGSFESALLATDSRNKLSAIGGEGSASASALAIAAKRRSAGDLLFAHKSLSREQLDRVRSCGSIGGGNSEDKLWVTHSTRPSKRRSSVPDTTCGGSGDSADGEEDDDEEDCEEDDEDQDEELENRSTLPRSLQSGPATTNSLPRLPTTNATAAQNTTNMHKTQSMYHFLQQNVKSARYRPPGFNRLTTTVPKRAVSAPGLQPTHQRRSRHKQQSTLVTVGCAIRNNRRRCFSPDRLRSEPNMSMLLSRKTIQNYFTIGRKTDESDSILVKPQFCNCCKKCLRLCCSYCMPSLETDVDDIDAVMERYIQGLDGEKKATILESNRTIKLKISNKWGTQSTDDECEDDGKDSETGNLPQIVLPETASNEDDELWLSAVWQDDVSQMSEAHSSPMLAARSGAKSATPSPIAPSSRRTTGSVSSQEWRSNDEDIDRLVVPNRSSVSSLGLRSDSMASVYSGAFGGECTVAVKGQVEFGLQYNYKTGALEILIKQCRDLAAVDAKRNRSDPYVKVYLLPDKSKSGKRKTKVKKHTLNPIFDECLKFHIALNGLETRTLWLTVWHSDMFGRNDFLGEVTMALENKVFDDPTPKWYTLQERTEPFDDMLSFKGDILVGLKFVPPDMTDRHKKGKRSRGTLHVLIKEAKSLTAVKANGTSDPFCKSYLLPDKGRSSKQKTTVMKKTVNPVWNHTFTYDDVTLQELAERCLELTVWDHDRLASNEFLGGVRFSLGTGKHYGKPVDWMDATGKEVSLWKSMLERPSLWVEGCLSLRPTLDQRSTQ